MPAKPPALVDKATFNSTKPPGHYIVAMGDHTPGAPSQQQLVDGTPPTYYHMAYYADFSGFAVDLETPIEVEESHYDPHTHKLIFKGTRFLYSPTRVFRPAGTYISIKSPVADIAFDADKDYDGGE